MKNFKHTEMLKELHVEHPYTHRLDSINDNILLTLLYHVPIHLDVINLSYFFMYFKVKIGPSRP